MSLDIEAACNALQKLQEEIGSPPGTEPLRTAAIALQFVWGNGHLHNFEDYLACFKPDEFSPSLSSFDTREQAEASLQQQMDPRHAHGVTIAGARYSVGYSPERGVRFLVRIPESAGLTTTTRIMIPVMSEALSALRQAHAHVRTDEGQESVDMALLAIHFILESGQEPLFENFLGNFDSNIPRPPLCSFGTREEADTWLNAHPRPPHSASVEIAGQRYSVGYARDSGLRVLVRRPALEEPGLTEQDE
jgi:hypothetical protein